MKTKFRWQLTIQLNFHLPFVRAFDESTHVCFDLLFENRINSIAKLLNLDEGKCSMTLIFNALPATTRVVRFSENRREKEKQFVPQKQCSHKLFAVIAVSLPFNYRDNLS